MPRSSSNTTSTVQKQWYALGTTQRRQRSSHRSRTSADYLGLVKSVMGGVDAAGAATTVNPEVLRLLSNDLVPVTAAGGYCAHNCIDELGSLYVGMLGAADIGDDANYDDDLSTELYITGDVDDSADSDSDSEIDDDNDIRPYIEDNIGDIESSLRDDFINAELLSN